MKADRTSISKSSGSVAPSLLLSLQHTDQFGLYKHRIKSALQSCDSRGMFGSVPKAEQTLIAAFNEVWNSSHNQPHRIRFLTAFASLFDQLVDIETTDSLTVKPRGNKDLNEYDVFFTSDGEKYHAYIKGMRLDEDLPLWIIRVSPGENIHTPIICELRLGSDKGPNGNGQDVKSNQRPHIDAQDGKRYNADKTRWVHRLWLNGFKDEASNQFVIFSDGLNERLTALMGSG